MSTWLCAAISVALGATYMYAAGAPRRHVVINAAALAVGVIAASAITRVSARRPRFWQWFVVAVGLVLLATAMFGLRIEGASRWIRVAGISLEPSLILLPLALVQFARDRSRVSSIGLTLASIGLAMQPDRAMAGALAAGLAMLWLHRRDPPVQLALAAALAGLVMTMLSPDVVAPVPFVEQVVQSAFAFHPLAGVAIAAGLAAMLLPAAAGFSTRTTQREVFAVFGATWLAVIAFAIVGTYPTPLVGYGSSAILGYCLSAGVLTPSDAAAAEGR